MLVEENNKIMALTVPKFADQKSKLTVFGYINQNRQQLSFPDVPLLVQCICIGFYFGREYFTVHGDNIKLSKEGNIAKGRTELPSINTVHGFQRTSLNDASTTELVWNFKASQIIKIKIQSARMVNFYMVLIILIKNLEMKCIICMEQNVVVT